MKIQAISKPLRSHRFRYAALAHEAGKRIECDTVASCCEVCANQPFKEFGCIDRDLVDHGLAFAWARLSGPRSELMGLRRGVVH
ncbi:hypothetical protein CH75_16800 [Dyella jiangningensis]|nr:hypothetical protein CH75_16800 [Dyella jiangningensis]